MNFYRAYRRERAASVLIGFCLLAAAGGCFRKPIVGPPTTQALGESEANVMILTTMVLAHWDSTGNWPESLDVIKDGIPDFVETMRNPVTGDDPGYEYVAPQVVQPPGNTVIIYQLRDGVRDESLQVGFASGLADWINDPVLDINLDDLDDLDDAEGKLGATDVKP